MLKDTAVIIQARLGSTRLPGKAFAEVCDGWTVTKMMLRRLAGWLGPPPILAVPAKDEDAFSAHGIFPPIVAGPEDDVLGRFLLAARYYKPQVRWVVRLTGDCPLIDVDTVHEAVAVAVSSGLSYLDWGNRPDGNDVEVFSYARLLEANFAAGEMAGDREHVTPWMRRHTQAPTPPLLPPECHGIKYSVDTQEDLDRVRRIVKALGVNCSRDEIIAYLRENP